MTKNLETADIIVKWALAISVIMLYLTDIIYGPFAKALTLLAVLMLAISIARAIIKHFFFQKHH